MQLARIIMALVVGASIAVAAYAKYHKKHRVITGPPAAHVAAVFLSCFM